MRRHFLLLLAAALLCSAPAWAATKPTAARRTATVTKQTAHFTLTSDLAPAYNDAILKLCETCLEGYRDVFGFSLYPNPRPGDKRMVVTAVKGKSMEVSSDWSVKPARMRITLPGQGGPGKPGQLMPYIVFRVARAFAIPLATYDNAAFSEGVADFLGAHVVDYAAGKLPANTVPFNYVQVVGSGSLQRARESARPGTPAAAAGLLDRIANVQGKGTVGQAMRLLGTANAPARPVTGPGGKRLYKVAALCQQLVNMTEEGELEKWFQEQHFPTVLDPASIAVAELWKLTDHNARCQLVCQRWGTNTTGILDGQPVQVILQSLSGERRTARVPGSGGLTLTTADNKGALVWYQPAAKRLYVVGSVRVDPFGLTATDQVLDSAGLSVQASPAP